MNKGMFSSKTGEWETPQVFFDNLNSEFNFDFDVCATRKNAKCVNYYTKEIDGLAKKWFGKCFMNPPYGREINKWIKKAYEESKKDYCSFIVGLLPARTDTKWFHDYIYKKAEIRFLKGRLKFSNSKNSAPFPSMIIIWKKSNEKGLKEFRNSSWIVKEIEEDMQIIQEENYSIKDIIEVLLDIILDNVYQPTF